ncbi:hypothetical protein HZ993_06690 [Rhodoferax sp. AJA081-3]|uniref:hypothetical protein n=1 Tax=Rhodoferax sp. AJA081-3 TaxID=2752316 RepID=UPI001ADF3F4F|nr:hypothetical protein [Rhodoferax sp. AJA081-3]QTN29500.1 hypothetical protein HZ993_06690 [Rhodoferax sp. AJA081-3]
MSQAQFINRGEQFFVIEGTTRYEGDCVWSRVNESEVISKPAYPVRIFVKSIRRCGLIGLVPLSQAKRLRIARLAKQVLESKEGDGSIELLEGY